MQLSCFIKHERLQLGQKLEEVRLNFHFEMVVLPLGCAMENLTYIHSYTRNSTLKNMLFSEGIFCLLSLMIGSDRMKKPLHLYFQLMSSKIAAMSKF